MKNTMSKQLLAEQLERAFFGEPWHGPSLGGLLEGVSAKEAAWHPSKGAHSIRDLVLHLTTWTDAARRRLLGEAFEPDAEADWPFADDGKDAWEGTRERLRSGARLLIETVRGFPAARLDETLTGFTYGARDLILGTLQHTAYHAGQIALMRKMRADF